MKKAIVTKTFSVAVSKPMIGVALGVALFGASYFSALSFAPVETPKEQVCFQITGGLQCQPRNTAYYSSRDNKLTPYDVWRFSVMTVSFAGSLILLGVSFVNWYDK